MDLHHPQEQAPLALNVFAVPELFDLIQVYLSSNSDLVSLTQVSKTFSQLFGPLLWHTVEIKTERQHTRFINTPEVQDAIRKHGQDWIRVIRIRTPKSLSPFLQAQDNNGLLPLTQLHTLEFPWSRRTLFAKIFPEEIFYLPTEDGLMEQELDKIYDLAAESFYSEREHFHRTRSISSLNNGSSSTTTSIFPESPPPSLLSPSSSSSSSFWLQRRHMGISIAELNCIEIVAKSVQAAIRLYQLKKDLQIVQQSQDLRARSRAHLQDLEDHITGLLTLSSQTAPLLSSSTQGLKEKSIRNELTEAYFAQHKIKADLQKILHSKKTTQMVTTITWGFPLPEDDDLDRVMQEEVDRISMFETEMSERTGRLNRLKTKGESALQEEGDGEWLLKSRQWLQAQQQQQQQGNPPSRLYQQQHQHVTMSQQQRIQQQRQQIMMLQRHQTLQRQHQSVYRATLQQQQVLMIRLQHSITQLSTAQQEHYPTFKQLLLTRQSQDSLAWRDAQTRNMAITGLTLECMRAYLRVQFAILSSNEQLQGQDDQDTTSAASWSQTGTPSATHALDPFDPLTLQQSPGTPLIAAGTAAVPHHQQQAKDRWDYVNPSVDVNQFLVPFLRQCCPNLRSFGSIFFPFMSTALLQVLSSVSSPLSSLRTLSMVSPDTLSCKTNLHAFVQTLQDLSPRLETLRFGAELELIDDDKDMGNKIETANTSRPTMRSHPHVPLAAQTPNPGLVETLISSAAAQWSAPLGIRYLSLEGTILDYDAVIWPRFLQRCAFLTTLHLATFFPDTGLFRQLAVIFKPERNACPLLQELSLSGGHISQDEDLATFLEACSGFHDSTEAITFTADNHNRKSNPVMRLGVTRLRFTNTNHIYTKSLEVLCRCYSKTLTHLTIDDCQGFSHLQGSSFQVQLQQQELEQQQIQLQVLLQQQQLQQLLPLQLQQLQGLQQLLQQPPPQQCPLLQLVSSLASLQVLDILGLTSHDQPSVDYGLSRNQFLTSQDLVNHYDWNVLQNTFEGSFTPWKCFQTLRVLKVMIAVEDTKLPVPDITDSSTDSARLSKILHKIYTILGSLTSLEELHLDTNTTATDLSPLPPSPLESTSVQQNHQQDWKQQQQPWLVSATLHHYQEQEKRHVDPFRPNPLQPTLFRVSSSETKRVFTPLPLSLESGLDELAGLKSLRVLQLGNRWDYEIRVPDLEWMVEHWWSLKEIRGIKRVKDNDTLEGWIKVNAPLLRYS